MQESNNRHETVDIIHQPIINIRSVSTENKIPGNFCLNELTVEGQENNQDEQENDKEDFDETANTEEDIVERGEQTPEQSNNDHEVVIYESESHDVHVRRQREAEVEKRAMIDQKWNVTKFCRQTKKSIDWTCVGIHIT